MNTFGPNDALLYDYRFKMRKTDEEDALEGWSYNWDSAECSTPHPTPRDGWATMFLIMNGSGDPAVGFITIFRKFNRHPFLTRNGQLTLDLDAPSNGDHRNMKIFQRGFLILEGFVTDNREAHALDPNVGNYCMLLSKSMEGMLLLRLIHAGMRPGYCAFLDHCSVEMELGFYGDTLGYDPSVGPALLKLETVTGLGEQDENGDSLATRMTLIAETRSNDKATATRTDLARCHISYRDGSYDPSMGPTIEMIAVQKKHRGKDLLPLLWHWARCFIQENFTLESLNYDTAPGHVMIKATQLTNCIIEHRPSAPDALRASVTDKEFFFRHAGFSVKQQKGVLAYTIGQRRPKDEEAILYIPLLSQTELQRRSQISGKNTTKALMKDARSKLWAEQVGALACDACGKISRGMLVCVRCRCNYYCNAACQRKDWRTRHRAWCGRTREQVHAMLVAGALL